MKTKRMINGFCRFVLPVAAFMLAACEADPVGTQVGQLPDESALSTVSGRLRNGGTPDNTMNILLTEGTSNKVGGTFYYQLTNSAASALSASAWVDERLIEPYNEAADVDRKLLPEANYEFPDGREIKIAAGDRASQANRIFFKADGLAADEYVLPVTVADQNAAQSDDSQTLYYNVTVRPQFVDENGYTLDNESNFFVVLYVDTRTYIPLLVTDYLVSTLDMTTFMPITHTIGNVVNLQTTVIGCEAATGRALLNLGSDMTYVLGHANQYIRPLQEQGRKVCLCIEGGGSGLGFCNLTDAQIDDFAAQVKTVIEQYGLDGVNLWDRNAGYGAEGMPAANTTSYPKLIKALREALGTEKLLTVCVCDKPTETFHDAAACGGITVGDYIDYAWSGYNSTKESPQVLDPWHPDADCVSPYTQKPIAGLAPENYGVINVPLHYLDNMLANFDNLNEWSEAGYNQGGERWIIVYSDLTTNLQDSSEGLWYFTVTFPMEAFEKSLPIEKRGMYLFDGARLAPMYDMPGVGNLHGGYGKWTKDW